MLHAVSARSLRRCLLLALVMSPRHWVNLNLVDDDRRARMPGVERVYRALPVRDGPLSRTSSSRVSTHAQCEGLPTSSPMTIPGIADGAMMVSSDR